MAALYAANSVRVYSLLLHRWFSGWRWFPFSEEYCYTCFIIVKGKNSLISANFHSLYILSDWYDIVYLVRYCHTLSSCADEISSNLVNTITCELQPLGEQGRFISGLVIALRRDPSTRHLVG